MTTIADLSKENLLLIFKQLDDGDFKQCQWVCRAWYPLAHCALLDDLYFDSYSQIRRFIACIDLNPNPNYLAAVKNILINALDEEAEDSEGNAVSPPVLLGKENIFKLFFRFPNLKQIIIDDAFKLLEEFDDEICAKFLNDCPKLEHFDACTKSDEAQTRYAALLRKLRYLQTTIHTDSICDIPDLVGFLADLPRLNTISDDFGHFGTFEKWLPLLDQAPSITTLIIKLKEDDELGFAEKYLATKTRVQQHQFIKRLSTIESVYLTCSPGTFLNSMKFIAKYLTGLTAISTQCHNRVSK